MILTRCPACQAMFRVNAEQLRARAGRVRCGKCRSAFDALENLVELGEPAALSEAPAQTGGTHAAAIDAEMQAGAALQTTPEPPPREPDTAPPGPALTGSSESTAAPLAASLSETEEEETAVPPLRAADWASEKASADSAEHSAFLAGSAVPSIEEEASRRTEGAQPEVVGEATGDTPDAALASTAGEASPASARARTSGRIAAWLWGTAAFGMLVLLAGQIAYFYRADIASAFPQSKPWLDAVCARVGCEVGLVRKPDLLSVEASALHPQPGRKDWLALTATLKNRAAFAMSYPHLELTLTDAADRAVVRRVFSPREYLKPDADVGMGLAANADLQIALTVDAAGVSAAGYRVYVFYP